ncbi:MAG: type II restriction endonuclease [bacterium]
MSERFEQFMAQLIATNVTLESLTDFEKVTQNVNKVKLKLHQLNYLLGREDLNIAIQDLFDENPNSFSVFGLLVAVRENDKMVLNSANNPVCINTYFNTSADVSECLEETGLEDIFKSNNITNLVDYVFGIEVGLDTNARKNRVGMVMEKCVAKAFINAGVEYREQVSSEEFVDIKESLGEDRKKFDFVVSTADKTYLIETNFYNGRGSKLNETARSYTDIAPKINEHSGYEFVWITDGQGWFSAKNKLEEAFNTIPSVYNLSTLDDFIERIK